MYNIFKYNYFSYLEEKYKDKFTLATNKQICVLPPILKKVNLSYFLIFQVLSAPQTQNDFVTRPIGLININIKTNKTTIFDLNDYDFCKEPDFNKFYYNLNNNKKFLPNKTTQNEEEIKIALQTLLQVANKLNAFSNIDKNKKYKDYLYQIQDFFPSNFFKFYLDLQNNVIEIVSAKYLKQRKIAQEDYNLNIELKKISNHNLQQSLKTNFKNYIINNLFSFIKQEVIPSLQGTGSYSKLVFYNEIGSFIKNINFDSYLNCFNANLLQSKLTQNQSEVLDKLKIEVIKIFSNSINNEYLNNNIIDTISKILIVFLNCLLVEELNKKCIKDYEEEIAESKDIFLENISKVKSDKEYNFLNKIFNDLSKDYLEENIENFSNIFYSYLNTFKNI